jgi:hypothetical protein
LEGFEALSLRGGAGEEEDSGTRRPELDRFSSPSETSVIEIDDTTVLDEASERASSDDFEVIEVKKGMSGGGAERVISGRALGVAENTWQRHDSARSVSSSGRKRKRSPNNTLDISNQESVRSKDSGTGVSERFQAFNVERSVSPLGREEFDAGIDVIDLEDDYWGDGAQLHWSPSPSRDVEAAGLPESAPGSPNLAPNMDELDYEPEDVEGGAGVLNFEPGSFAADSSAEEFEFEGSEEEVEMPEEPVVSVAPAVAETLAEQRARGMPDYEKMDLDDLQVSFQLVRHLAISH